MIYLRQHNKDLSPGLETSGSSAYLLHVNCIRAGHGAFVLRFIVSGGLNAA